MLSVLFTHDAVGAIMGNAGCVSSESTYGRPFSANMNVRRLHWIAVNSKFALE